MTAAKLVLTILTVLNGRLQAQVAPTVAPLTKIEDQTCIPTKNCSGFPNHRGICVQTTTRQCWDACAPEIPLSEYAGTTTDESLRVGIAMMVQQARTALNLCMREEFRQGAECDLGTRCTFHTLYRGVCTVSTTNGVSKNTCLDMCDTSIPLEQYEHGSGEREGNMKLVQQVRGGRDPNGETFCPGQTVWMWLWFPILLCCLIGSMAGLFYAYRRWKSAVRSQRKQQQYMDQDYQDYQDDFDYQGTGPPQDMEQAYMQAPAPAPAPVEAPLTRSYQEPQTRSFQPQHTDQRSLVSERMPVMDSLQEVPEQSPLMQQFQPPPAAPQPVAPRAPLTGQGMSMAAPSTFYNSQYSTGGYGQPTTQPMTMPGYAGSYR